MLYEEGSTRALKDDAHDILGVLTDTYPGHPWAVRVDGGICFIRHLAFDGPWGMTFKVGKFNHDAAAMKRSIIRMAGEWLERAGLARGRANGDEILRVEGIPDKYQPGRPLENMEVVINKTGEPLRETPRPQVLNS